MTFFLSPYNAVLLDLQSFLALLFKNFICLCLSGQTFLPDNCLVNHWTRQISQFPSLLKSMQSCRLPLHSLSLLNVLRRNRNRAILSFYEWKQVAWLVMAPRTPLLMLEEEEAAGAHKNDFDDLLFSAANANFPVSEPVLTKWQSKGHFAQWD